MQVEARAPGKIILAGEHAVVHGSTALAASINLYTNVTLRLPSTDRDDGTLRLLLEEMELEFSWPVARLKEVLSGLDCPFPSTPTSCSTESIEAIAALVKEQSIPEGKKAFASGISAFLWLFLSIQGFKAAEVLVSSELPPGAGLGSSAAFCVALSAVLLVTSDAINYDIAHRTEWFKFGGGELELLNKWAFEGEKIIHGKPSGVDNTVSSYGNVIQFRSGICTPIKNNIELTMLITDTKVEKNTKALVASVSERASKHPDAMKSVFNAVNSISKELITIFQSPVCDSFDFSAINEKEEKIQELMEMNQGLLQCMGVSHSSIETVLRTTSKYELVSKLTGAGGGGCVLTLLPILKPGEVVDNVVQELDSCGFNSFLAKVGVDGVEIVSQCYESPISEE